MSETLSQDPNQGPDTLTSGYTLTPSYPSATTLSDPSGLNLPPFSTFAADIDGNGSFSTFGDARLLDISNWDCYTETRLERTDNGISIITSQPQYRPWESKPLDTGGVTTFADAFASQNGAGPRLPSFQSQFQAFNDQVTTAETTTLTTLTPVSPNSTSQNITTLGNFHTLNPRNYPLVPAPIQAREIPSIQQQYMDERHIQLYTHPSGFTQNGTVIQNIGAPAVLTVLKSEPMHQMPEATGIKIQNITTLHHSQFQNPMSTIIESNNSSNIYNQMDKKLNGVNGTNFNGSVISPTRGDYRKKERRKMRASSLESSNESDGASSNMDNTSAENSGQVAAVSSTASFKHQHNSGASGLVSINTGNSGLMDVDEISGGVDKQVKKKRKRCGECIGCQRKDNCGDCAPCRNDKSHQICKQRRCEKLTEKKNLYGENGFVRDGSRRGRGKGRRGGGSCRGRKAVVAINSQTTITAVESASTVTTGLSGVVGRGDSTSSTTPQSTSIQRQNLQTQQHMAKSIVTQSVSAAETVAVPLQVPTHQPITGVSVQQSSPLASVPFYTEPNRFTTSVWQTDPNPSWTQSQFIQQLGPNSATAIDTTYTTQQYPNNMYQPATYSQSGFEPIAANTYYTGAVQVLTNRSPSVIAQQQHPQQLTPRACGSTAIYTPSPSPSHQPSRPQSTHQLQYEQYQFSNSAAMPTTPSDSQSRPSSVNSNAPTPSTYPSTSQQQQSNPGYSSSGNNNATYTSGGLSVPHTAAGEQLPGSGSPAYTRMECRSSSSQEQPSTSEEVSRNSNAYPGVYNNGGIVNNQTHSKKWANPESVIWESNNQHQPHLVDESSAKLRIPTSNRHPEHEISNRNSEKLNQHRVEINSKIKNMILNKQEKKNGIENEHNSKSTGHFLWNSHHCCAGTELNNGGLKYFRMLQIIETFWNQKNHGHKKIGIGSDRKLSTINEVKNILMQNANRVFPTIKEYITLEITCFRNCDGIQRNRMKNMFSLYIYV